MTNRKANRLYNRWLKLGSKMWPEPSLWSQHLLSEAAAVIEDTLHEQNISLDSIEVSSMGEYGFFCKIFAHQIPND